MSRETAFARASGSSGRDCRSASSSSAVDQVPVSTANSAALASAVISGPPQPPRRASAAASRDRLSASVHSSASRDSPTRTLAAVCRSFSSVATASRPRCTTTDSRWRPSAVSSPARLCSALRSRSQAAATSYPASARSTAASEPSRSLSSQWRAARACWYSACASAPVVASSRGCIRSTTACSSSRRSRSPTALASSPRAAISASTLPRSREQVGCLAEVVDLPFWLQCVGRGAGGALQDGGPFFPGGGDRECLLAEHQRLVGRGELSRARRRLCQPVASTGTQGLAVATDRCRLQRLHVVRRDRAGELVVTGGLEVVGHCEVPGPAVGLGQHAVGDLADDALDEGVLPPLR